MKKLFIFMTICTLLGCKTKQHSSANTATSTESGNEVSIKEEMDENTHILVASIGEMENESALVQILKSSIDGNLLRLTVSYSGGCSDHSFAFVGSNMIAKSLPPIRNVRLYHFSDDTCREYIEEELTIDLRALAYQQEAGSQIKLSIAGSKEYLLYTYE